MLEASKRIPVLKIASFQACDPADVALKAFFIGPQSENQGHFLNQIKVLIESWLSWRSKNYFNDGPGISKGDQGSTEFKDAELRFQKLFQSLITRFESEIPAYSPHYMSHMLSECTQPAILGHLLALLHNPNNVTREASSIGLDIEKESIALLAKMLNLATEVPACGHFTSGGTLANFEALSRALKRQLHWIQTELLPEGPMELSLQSCAHRGWKDAVEKPSHLPSLVEVSRRIEKCWGVEWKPRVILPESAHYSWEKIVSLLGLGSDSLVYVPLDHDGRMDIAALDLTLKDEIQKGSTILAVVSIVGSTELGSIDNINEIQKLLDTWRLEAGLHIWHHVDAAYGGFFTCCPQHELTSLWHHSLKEGFRFVNSVTLDPHKLGYVPYSAGAIVVRNPRDYFLFIPEAPYIDVDTHWPGAQTIEGSRSATGSTALWLSARSIGLDEKGYGRLLLLTIKQKKLFEKLLSEDPRFLLIPGCHSNLSAFALSPDSKSTKLSSSNSKVQKLMEESQRGNLGYRISTTRFNLARHPWLKNFLEKNCFETDSEYFQVVRLVFMNPFIESKESRVSHVKGIVRKFQGAI